jgi:hypothetical protein
MELAHGAGDLLALLGGELLHALDAVEGALALGGGHGVELREAVAEAILLAGGKLIEAGLMLEGALLFGGGEVLVILHPVAEVAGTDSARSGGGVGMSACIQSAWAVGG